MNRKEVPGVGARRQAMTPELWICERSLFKLQEERDDDDDGQEIIEQEMLKW